MRIVDVVKIPILVLGTFWVAVATGQIVIRLSTPDETDVDYSEAAYRRLTKTITDSLAQRVHFGDFGAENGVILLLRSNDIIGCEDIGRQIRDLRRATPSHLPLELWTDSSDAALVREFLDLERVEGVRTRSVALESVFYQSAGIPITPLVLVVGKNWKTLGGIAHPGHFPNTRPKSFAQELAVPLRNLETPTR